MSKINPTEWTDEERNKVVSIFGWLLKEDKKQNPHLYSKNNKNIDTLGKDNKSGIMTK